MAGSSQGKTLVVGAGYVGAELLRLLRDRGVEALGIRRSNPDSESGILSADITDPGSLGRLRDGLDGPVGTVIHCASSGRGGTEAYRRVFLEGCANLLETLAPDRLLFVSSTSVYPQCDGSVVTEESETRGSRPTSEILVETEGLVRERDGVVARLSGIYGPGRSVILKRFLAGEARIDVGGLAEGLEEGRILNQIHRDDAASALAHLALDLAPGVTAGEAFNVSDARPLSQRTIYLALAERLGLPFPEGAAPDPERKRAWTHKAVSSEKLRSLGWSPTYPDYLAALEHDPRILPSIRKQLAK